MNKIVNAYAVQEVWDDYYAAAQVASKTTREDLESSHRMAAMTVAAALVYLEDGNIEQAAAALRNARTNLTGQF